MVLLGGGDECLHELAGDALLAVAGGGGDKVEFYFVWEGEGGKWREVVGRWFGRWVPIERECPETYFQPPSGDRIGLFCYYTSPVSND